MPSKTAVTVWVPLIIAPAPLYVKVPVEPVVTVATVVPSIRILTDMPARPLPVLSLNAPERLMKPSLPISCVMTMLVPVLALVVEVEVEVLVPAVTVLVLVLVV